ncbi:spliceosome-associated protein CWC27 homolog [Adelges cooleyi]|uniref:spliceosome-associated protein CWC27 homolog n=1 Tax=Adelges cooleyi TaxID=133065 RepID=UPI002180083B|nr:spliceosome-associated protein CWC27 homolog [Adelges cooleyi]
MSNIYIQEPPTSGKVVLKTSFGDIEVELWSREAPKACRNFVQLCLEGYYDGVLFHRIVKDFIAQGGDPTGTGAGGESIYGQPFKDEIHSRLRFNRRGLVAMANAGKDDNGSQFFFTLGSSPELQSKHTIFGKVAGDTIYNLTKLNEVLVDKEERPIYEQKILKTVVLNNPFPDIVPRIEKKIDKSEKGTKKKEKNSGVKNFKLLSFGEEAEEDEEELVEVVKEFSGRPKSTHDVLKDPQLSAEPAVPDSSLKEDLKDLSEDNSTKINIDDIRSKLSSNKKKKSNISILVDPPKEDEIDDYEFGKELNDEKKKKAEEIRREIKELKGQLSKKKKGDKTEKDLNEKPNINELEPSTNPLKQDYLDTIKLYSSKKEKIPKKGTSSREELTLNLLNQFKDKLHSIKKSTDKEDHTKDTKHNDDDNWLGHTLHCEEKNPVLAKDANKKDDDWFEIYDPRSALNKRKRDVSKKDSKTDKDKKIKH